MSDFNSTTTPVARKEHRCEECFRVIGKGETYSRTASVWEGSFFTNVACAHCAAAREILRSVDPDYNEVFYGGLTETLTETWSDYAQDSGIARIAASHFAKWRYQSGALMPVPNGGAS